MIRVLFLCSLLFSSQGLLFASAYTTWLSNFEQTLDVGPSIDASEKQNIDEALQIIPQSSGTDYPAWLSVYQTLLDAGPSFDATEKARIQYALRALPQNNEGQYPAFLSFFTGLLGTMGNALTETDFTLLNFALKAKTKKPSLLDLETFESAWQAQYQSLKAQYNTLGSREKKLLDYFKRARPDSVAPSPQTLSAQNPNSQVSQDLENLLRHSPVQITDAAADNNYPYGDKIVSWIEVFYRQLRHDADAQNSVPLQQLATRLENLKEE